MAEVIQEGSIKSSIKSLSAKLTSLKVEYNKKLADKYRDVNDIYIKSKTILEQDKMLWFKHRNDQVDFDIANPWMYDKVKNEWYYLKVDFIAYDPEQIMAYVDYIMEESKKTTDKYTYLKQEVDKQLTNIKANFNQNHYFSRDMEPKINISYYKNIKVKEVLRYAKKAIETDKENSTYISDVLITNQLVYLQALEKSYAAMENKYKSDQKAVKIIDELYKEIINEETIVMEFDTKCLNVINESFESLYEQLNKLYNNIKS